MIEQSMFFYKPQVQYKNGYKLNAIHIFVGVALATIKGNRTNLFRG